MKEKLKIICLILVIVALLMFIVKELVYMGAYYDCRVGDKHLHYQPFECVGILNGG